MKKHNYLSVIRLPRAIYLICTLMIISLVSFAESNISISELTTKHVDNKIVVNCSVTYDVHDKVEIALNNGIQMTFSLVVELRRDRGYWPDNTVAAVNKNFVIKYHALSEHYVVMNVGEEVERSFPSLKTAFINQGLIEDIDLASLDLLIKDEQYYIRARASLLSEKLPLPLRVKSYFSADWRPSTGWTRWPI